MFSGPTAAPGGGRRLAATAAVQRLPRPEPVWTGVFLDTWRVSERGPSRRLRSCLHRQSWVGALSLAAGFIEDAWKVTPRLELRAGFRFESTNGWNEVHGRASNYGFTDGVINTNPTIGSSALSDNRAKFMPEPRIGVAYDLFGNGKTAVRASFGVHRALLDTLDYRLDQTAPFNTTLSFSNTTVDQLASSPVDRPPGADRSRPATCSRISLPRRCWRGPSRSSSRSPRLLRSPSAM